LLILYSSHIHSAFNTGFDYIYFIREVRDTDDTTVYEQYWIVIYYSTASDRMVLALEIC
jgi:hypothetical protein